jgi:SAM-dependent methyltransferase
VEANYENCAHWPNYFVCQADIQRLPLALNSFDIIVCLGVIQHTPDPELTIATLAKYLKPGATLVIDHYARNYSYTFSRRLLRPLLLRMPPVLAQRAAFALARALLPMHKMLWSNRRGIGRLRTYLSKISPLVDYYGAYPQLDRAHLSEWAILDTHDTLTDRYKHLRSVDEIKRCLVSCGLVEIEVYEGGNGVEARARRTSTEP